MSISKRIRSMSNLDNQVKHLEEMLRNSEKMRIEWTVNERIKLYQYGKISRKVLIYELNNLGLNNFEIVRAIKGCPDD